MANTYTQLHMQLVFAVKFRQALIDKSWEDELYKYITGIVQNHEHKLLSINGMPDHLHLLIGYRPHQALADLLKEIKGDSSKWINDRKFTKTKFNWQEGYGAFSYSKSEVPRICSYIESQKIHHQNKTFLEEYKNLLNEFQVDYDERYIFKELM